MIIVRNIYGVFIHIHEGKLYGVTIIDQDEYLEPNWENCENPLVHKWSLTLLLPTAKAEYVLSKCFYASPSAGCVNIHSSNVLTLCHLILFKVTKDAYNLWSTIVIGK